MKKENAPGEETKTDLKHDSMKFTTPFSGEDVEDADDPRYEEDIISAEELDAIEDLPDNEAAALNATENDLQEDADQLTDEDWTDDLPDMNEVDDDNNNHHRNKE
ncbi:MAG: hypothetical protein ABIT96_10145 [Ferruginibacter sp.]